MNAKIQSIEKKDNFYLITLSKTIFRAQGGGQPADSGFIRSEQFYGRVVDVQSSDNRPIHHVEVISGEPKQGEEVLLELDTSRRERLTKMHSGEHLLFGALQKTIDDIRMEKIQLAEDESLMYVRSEKLDWSFALKALKVANRIIAQARPILHHSVTADDLDKFPELRIRKDRIKDDVMKIIEIKDHDKSACSGTHLTNTKDIVNIIITRINRNKGLVEVRFRVDCIDYFLEQAICAKEAAEQLNCETEELRAMIEKQHALLEGYKEQVRKQQQEQEVHADKEMIDGVTYSFVTVGGFERKILLDKAKPLQKEDEVLVVLNTTDERSELLLFAGVSTGVDASALIKMLCEKLDGKGGGGKAFAQGSIGKMDIEKIKKILAR